MYSSAAAETARRHRADYYSWKYSTSTESESSYPVPVGGIIDMSQLLPPLVYPDHLSESDLDLSSEFTSEGGESTGDVEKPPSPELLNKLVSNLEYHFGDEALARDLFLLKHIKRQPEGYVSLKLLAGYKKVKKLSRNWRVVGIAAKNSALLEVNDCGTRVRRRTPLPPSLAAELPVSRSLVAVGIPPDLCSIEALAGRFAAHGPVAALQLVKPGKGNPPQLYSMLSKMPDSCDSPCAIIEFEDVWGASKALQDSYDPPMSLHVMRNTRRRDRGTPELRAGRPFHHQLHRLMNETSKRNSESSGSDGDESLRLTMTRRVATSRHMAPPVGRICLSMPNSPALRRCPFAHHTALELRSPRGPDGSKGFAQTQHALSPT